MVEKNLGPTEYAVIHAIAEMLQANQRVSTALVAQRIGCHPVTARRAIATLIRAGKLQRHGSTRKGFTYHVQLY